MIRHKFSKQERDLQEKIVSRSQLVVAVDLDGTLASFNGWKGYFEIGKPMHKIINQIRVFKKQGAHIIIHTCRTTTPDNKAFPEVIECVKKWLRKNSVPFDEIWCSTGKPFAHIYLDDRAVRVSCPQCMKFLKAPKLPREI
jgi:hypothetical protein